MNPYSAHKTGKKKEILGYSCEEYLIEDTAAEVRMWISDDLGKKVRKNMLNNQQTFGALFYHAAYTKGMALEYDVLDKDDGKRTVMKVIDIDMNRSHSIPTRGYAVMSMKNQSSEDEEESPDEDDESPDEDDESPDEDDESPDEDEESPEEDEESPEED